MGFICIFTLSLLCFNPSVIIAQQPYVAKATTNCTNTDKSTSVLGYFCNGLNKTCQAYLIFRSRQPYTTVSAISSLFAADPSHLSTLNGVSNTDAFEPEKQVIVPVTCSCSGDYSQVNVTYTVQHGETYFSIANNTFQGLSTCQAMQERNNISSQSLFSGTRIVVSLRCACPTRKQVDDGTINYLLSYAVVFGDWVSKVSQRFGVDTGKTLESNELSVQNSVIFPFTTLLIPLEDPPSSSDTVVPPPPLLAPSPPPPGPGGKSSKTWVYVLVGVLAGTFVIISLGVTVFCLVLGKREKKSLPSMVSSGCHDLGSCEKPFKTISDQDQEPNHFLYSLSSIAQSLKVYKFQELQSSTENFGTRNLIRGSVYRARINGDYAVIKRMDGDVSNEINLLSKLNHFNLIRLSGFCFNDGDWYLVYEYASNGSLSERIHFKNVSSSGKLLSWTQRMQIALDVATGLNYLHSFTNPPYVHKDINSSNILLDTDFRAKIKSFGLASSAQGQRGDEFALTRHIIGTKGYMAPEYLENGLVSTNLDVYSFGVLMLEIVTGKEAADLDENADFSGALTSEENGYDRLEQVIDPSLQGNYPSDLAKLVIRLIRSCLMKDYVGRPGMDETVQSLSMILTASLNWESSYNISVYPIS